MYVCGVFKSKQFDFWLMNVVEALTCWLLAEETINLWNLPVAERNYVLPDAWKDKLCHNKTNLIGLGIFFPFFPGA